MATVTIHRANGATETITGVDDDSTIYYENLAFSDTDVISVSVQL